MRCKIDISNSRLVRLGLFYRKTLAFKDIQSVSICPLKLTLLDEIGLVAFGLGDIEFWVHETDNGWRGLVSFLQLSERLPQDWYAQVEAGKVFEIILD